MNSIDYARGFDVFVESACNDIRQAWENGNLVPCEECYGEGFIPVMRGNTVKELHCNACEGTGYVMEKSNVE